MTFCSLLPSIPSSLPLLPRASAWPGTGFLSAQEISRTQPPWTVDLNTLLLGDERKTPKTHLCVVKERLHGQCLLIIGSSEVHRMKSRRLQCQLWLVISYKRVKRSPAQTVLCIHAVSLSFLARVSCVFQCWRFTGSRCHCWWSGLLVWYSFHAVMNDVVVQNVLNKICSVTDVRNQ